MFTRVSNLILASLALLIILIVEAGYDSALVLARPHHGPISVRKILIDAIVIFWFAGALGLFSRKRIAWVGSLLGIGASVCFFVSCLVDVVGLWVFQSSNPAYPVACQNEKQSAKRNAETQRAQRKPDSIRSASLHLASNRISKVRTIHEIGI
jgi:hypothetical protein